MVSSVRLLATAQRRTVVRTVRLLAIVLAAIAILSVAASADASVTTADLAAVLPVAQAAWPDSACRGIENVHLNADDALGTTWPNLTTDTGDRVEAGANKPTCEVWISSGVTTRLALCDALTHEFGHLALTGTTADHTATGIMAAHPAVYPPCWGRFNDQPRTPRAWAESVLPKGTRCTLATTRPRRRIYRCSHGRRAVVRLAASGEVRGVVGETGRTIVTLDPITRG